LRFLLDTHTYLWWLGRPDLVSRDATDIISDEANEIFVSIATFWELAIKSSLGKISLSKDVHSLATELPSDGFVLLPINSEHCSAVANLPFHHRDPFDRMLLAQVLVEDFTLLSCDREFGGYPVRVVW
jgi:PIN domain nuclease of toxin-antitoxin system